MGRKDSDRARLDSGWVLLLKDCRENIASSGKCDRAAICVAPLKRRGWEKRREGAVPWPLVTTSSNSAKDASAADQ